MKVFKLEPHGKSLSSDRHKEAIIALHGLYNGHFLYPSKMLQYGTGCPRKFVPRLPEDYDKAAKSHRHTFT